MISVEQFDALKTKQAVKITLKGCMANLKGVTLYVGRRSKSKKYRYESLTLNREPGKAAPAHLRNLVTITLYKRIHPDGESVTAAMGDMGASVTSFEVIPDKELTIHQRLKIAGCKLGSHESDLYVESTPKALKVLESYPNPVGYTTFRNERDGTPWLDIPFANDSFWAKKAKGGTQ